jgi:hypothetical protein
MGIPIFGQINDLVKGAFGLVDDLHHSGEEKAAMKQKLMELQLSMQRFALEQETKVLEAQASIVKAEAKGDSWLQRNWRPLLMLSFTLILVNNFIILPYVPEAQPLEFPAGFWSLLTIGVGGYVGLRSWEKVKNADSQKAVFEDIRP